MRHNQNGRRFRGRNNGQGGHQNSGHSHNSGNNGRRVNPRVQTFDSNGPDVRIRGNAYQINEKYVALARDAASAGDRVLAESYLQHAEYYQRFINEMTEEQNRNNPQPQQQPITGDEPQPDIGHDASGHGRRHGQNNGNGNANNGHGNGNGHEHDHGHDEEETLNDLDQGFLVGNRKKAAAEENDAPKAEKPARRPRVREAETA